VPRGDGTGPSGQGPGTGRGLRGRGMGSGRGRGTGRATNNNSRLGRMGGNLAGAGPGGQCVCPSCGATATHQVGVPCYRVKCPKCGTAMVRK
jgi:hypothetical protein